MSGPRRSGLVAAVIAIAFVVAPAFAVGPAPPTMVDFEQDTVGAPPAGGNGLTFADGIVVVDANGAAGSLTHAAEQCRGTLDSCGRGGLFEIGFDEPQSTVTLSVALAGQGRQVELELVSLDENDQELGRGAATTVAAGAGDTVPLTVGATGDGNHIAKVRIELSPAAAAVDKANPTVLPAGVLVGRVVFQADIPVQPPALQATFASPPVWSPDGRTLSFTVRVTNSGGTPSDQTQLRVSAPGAGEHAPVPVPPIEANQRQAHQLVLRFAAPPTTSTELTVMLTPASGETGTADDAAHLLQVSVKAPSAAPGSPAALRLTVTDPPVWQSHGHELAFTATVTNGGGVRSGQTELTISDSASDGHAPVTVKPIEPHQAQNHQLILLYSDKPADSTEVTLTLRPAPGETGTASAGDAAHTVRLVVTPPAGTGAPWGPITGGAIAALLVVCGLVWQLRGRLSRAEKAEWELKASDGEPPRECSGNERICRRECDVDLAARRITQLDCTRESTDGDVLSIEGKAIERLNDARTAYREKRAADARAFVRDAEELVEEELLGWPPTGAPSAVRLEARIEGSKAECKFKVLRCAMGERPSLLSRVKRALGLEEADQSPWKEVAQWKNTVDDKATVEVGTLAASLLADPSRRGDLAETLRRQLGALAGEP